MTGAESATRSHGTLRQLFFFGLIGGSSALVDAGVFWVLNHFGMIAWVASAISFMSAFAINYFGNRSLVFRAAHSRRTLWRYIALVLFNLALSSGVVALGVALGLIPIVAKIVSMAVVATVNYFVMRLWVFRPSVQREADPVAATASPNSSG